RWPRDWSSDVCSSDLSTFEIQGSSVLCQSEHQFVTTEGAHRPSGATEPANALFAQNFTQHYAELSKKEPVFADLQNVFDLAMAEIGRASCRERCGAGE